MSIYGTKPPKLTLTNVATGDSLIAQFNPAELEEQLGANFAHLNVPGLSHTVKHFVNTTDVTYKISLANHCIGEGKEGLARIMGARNFLRALVHPRLNNAGDRDGAPRALLIWPGFFSLVVRVTGLGFKYTQFNTTTGAPIAYTASVDMELQRDKFVSMEDVLDEVDENQ